MKIWDFAFALFVLMPIVTGGLWFRGEGFKLEYTQPAAAAFVLAVWLFARSRRKADAWRDSFFLRAISRAYETWCTYLQRHGTKALLVPWLFVGGAWFGAALSRHLGFRSHAMDLGIFTNGLWNLTELGWPYSSLKGGVSLLTDHQIFLHYPIALLFRFWRDPTLLLALQAWGLAATPVAVFLLLRQRLSAVHPAVALIPLLLFTYAPIRSANLFDFHPEVLMLPLFLFAAWGLQERTWPRRIAGFALLLAALGAKESAGPVAFGLGMAWLLGAAPANVRQPMRIFGAFTMALGLGAFVFDTKVMPRLLGAHYVYSDVYAPLGSSLGELALAPFRDPGTFLGRIFAWSRFKFLGSLLLPLLLLPLAGWPALLAAAPGFFMLALTAGDQRLSTGFHYAIEPAVGVLFALPSAFATGLVRRRQGLVLLLLPWAFLLAYNRSEAFHWRFYEITPHQRWVRSEVLPFIRRDADLAAPGVLVPHVSTRRWISSLPTIETEKGVLVDCVAWERSVDQNPLDGPSEAKVRAVLAAEFVEEFRCGSFGLYRRLGAPACLTQQLECPRS